MGLIFVPVYIKYLGIESYGLIGFFASLQAWFSLLDMGMTPALGREIARFTGGSRSVESLRDLLRSIEIITLIIIVILSLTIYLSSDWLATSWLQTTKASDQIISDSIKIISIVIGLRFFEGIYRSVIVGLQKLVLFNIVNCTLATIRSVGAIFVLAYVSATIQSFFIWQAIFSLITVFTLFLLTYFSLPTAHRTAKFSFAEILQIKRFAGGMSLNIILAIALMNIDKTLLSKFLTLTDFGYYTLASTVAAGLYMIIMPTEQAFYPKFCELHAKGLFTDLAATFHKSAQIISVLTGSAGFLLIFYGQSIVQLWTQNSELAQHTSVIISILAIANMISGALLMVHILQLTYGWTRISIYVNVINLVLFIPAIFWVVPHYGAIGAAFIWLALNLGGIIISVHFTFRRIMTSEKWKWYWQDIVLPVSTCGIVVALFKYLLPSPLTNISRILTLLSALSMALLLSSLVASQVRLFLAINLKKYFIHKIEARQE
jgi:O-antigen/teichoic acid export membrane protein